MADILPVKPQAVEFREKVDADIIECLEDWLEQAKAGRFSGVALSAVLRDGKAATSVSASDNWTGLMGAVSVLQHRVISERPVVDGWGG